MAKVIKSKDGLVAFISEDGTLCVEREGRYHIVATEITAADPMDPDAPVGASMNFSLYNKARGRNHIPIGFRDATATSDGDFVKGNEYFGQRVRQQRYSDPQ
jgi:hypothetical protein